MVCSCVNRIHNHTYSKLGMLWKWVTLDERKITVYSTRKNNLEMTTPKSAAKNLFFSSYIWMWFKCNLWCVVTNGLIFEILFINHRMIFLHCMRLTVVSCSFRLTVLISPSVHCRVQWGYFLNKYFIFCSHSLDIFHNCCNRQFFSLLSYTTLSMGAYTYFSDSCLCSSLLR